MRRGPRQDGCCHTVRSRIAHADGAVDPADGKDVQAVIALAAGIAALVFQGVDVVGEALGVVCGQIQGKQGLAEPADERCQSGCVPPPVMV